MGNDPLFWQRNSFFISPILTTIQPGETHCTSGDQKAWRWPIIIISLFNSICLYDHTLDVSTIPLFLQDSTQQHISPETSFLLSVAIVY